MAWSLDRLLRPRSIAVIGGREAEWVVEQCDKIGYDGKVWPVHPTRGSVRGRTSFRTLDDLPAAPDAAFIGVNRVATVALVRALARIGAGGAVCYASGFKEVEGTIDGGASLQAALVGAAGRMPIIGPNTYGFINALDAVPLWPGQHGLARAAGGVAILTQSSNIALNLSMQRRGLPIAYLLAAGNQAQLGLAELGGAVLADRRVTALGLHIEGLDDVKSFERLAGRARQLKKPIVGLIIGKSKAARRTALSHTASLASSTAVVDALFARLGIARVHSLPEFLETLKLLHVLGPLPGSEICCMSCSGGEAALIADAAERRNVTFRDLTDAQKNQVEATLNPMVAVANPLDYHTFDWGDGARLADTFAAMMAANFDLSMLALDYPRSDRCDDGDWAIAADAMATAAARTGARAAVVSTMPETLPEPRARALIAAGVAPLSGFPEALAAIEAAAGIGTAWAQPAPAPLLAPETSVGAVRLLDEHEAKLALASCGLTILEGRRADTPDQAAAAACELGFPVALKALGIAHKSECGAVRLGLPDAAAVGDAARAMPAAASGFLVERMAGPPVAELIVGVSRDPDCGLSLSIGAGGVLVALLEDSVTLTLPTTEAAIRAAILSLKVAMLLCGYRGRPWGDIDGAVAAVRAVVRYVETNATLLEELDVNPLLVLAEGEGAVAADALIRIREATP